MKRTAEILINLVREYQSMQHELRQNADGQALYTHIVMMGRGAAAVGDFNGMRALHDAAEYLTGDTNEIGYLLNQVWDGIGGWSA